MDMTKKIGSNSNLADVRESEIALSDINTTV